MNGKKFDRLNVLKSDGAVLVSINGRYKRYYANGSYGKKLNMKRFKYERH